jgi:phthiodiolone/phenolphthiodiolone dimycocerosates ketoreductase
VLPPTTRHCALILSGIHLWTTILPKDLLPLWAADKLQVFGGVGVRHVVLAPVSELISRRAAIYGLRATRRIARLLANER